jgi:hypothetical protein
MKLDCLYSVSRPLFQKGICQTPTKEGFANSWWTLEDNIFLSLPDSNVSVRGTAELKRTTLCVCPSCGCDLFHLLQGAISQSG